MKKSLLALSVMLIIAASAAFATSFPEQVPRPQTLQQQIDLVGGGVMDGMTVTQNHQRQKMLLVKQRFDPPMMVKTVLPAGVVIPRMLWLDTSTSSKNPHFVGPGDA